MTDRSQTDYRDVSVTVNGGSPLNIVSVQSLNIHNEEVMNLLLFLLAVLIAKGRKPCKERRIRFEIKLLKISGGYAFIWFYLVTLLTFRIYSRTNKTISNCYNMNWLIVAGQ